MQSVHKSGTHYTRLAQELQRHLCAPEKNLSSGSHMSHPLLVSHLPCTASTSSSTLTVPSATTPVHALQSGQHDLLQEHPEHQEHLQALPVDKQRHQESLLRENLRSGGNPRTTTPTGKKPKELATVSKIMIIVEIHINYMMHKKNLEKKITELQFQSLKKCRNLEKLEYTAYWILKYRRRPTSNRRCISTIPWKALQILISKMEKYKRR